MTRICPGVMHVTVTLRKVSVGTELKVVQDGVPDVIPEEACYLGWQESLILLAKVRRAGDSRVVNTSRDGTLCASLVGASRTRTELLSMSNFSHRQSPDRPSRWQYLPTHEVIQ